MTPTIRVKVGRLAVNGETLLEGYDKTTELAPRIGLVGCGSLKAIEPCAARDLYGSTLFRLARAYVEATCDRWYILSAKFGLLEPDRRIGPYEARLSIKGAAAWGRRVGEALDAQVPHDTEANATIICLAGGLYASSITTKDRDFFWEEPLAGMAIGLRLQWLKENTPR